MQFKAVIDKIRPGLNLGTTTCTFLHITLPHSLLPQIQPTQPMCKLLHPQPSTSKPPQSKNMHSKNPHDPCTTSPLVQAQLGYINKPCKSTVHSHTQHKTHFQILLSLSHVFYLFFLCLTFCHSKQTPTFTSSYCRVKKRSKSRFSFWALRPR
jgi:hypothetical protein